MQEISQNSSEVCLLFKRDQDRLCTAFYNVIATIATVLLLGLMWDLYPLTDARLSFWKDVIASDFYAISYA